MVKSLNILTASAILLALSSSAAPAYRSSSTSTSYKSKSTSTAHSKSSGHRKTTSDDSSSGLEGKWYSGPCSDPGASDSEPNGNQDFMNCQLDTSSGWVPPPVKLSDLKILSAADAVATDGSPFGPCAQYVDMLEQVGSDTGVPATLLMSIAMQESTCNPGITGANGEEGMFQLTSDKCQDGSNCYDAETGARKAAAYFNEVLAQSNGVFEAMGQYNGWYPGMTKDGVLSLGDQGRCSQEENLDYLYQVFNGYVLGKDGSQIGTIHNGCGSNNDNYSRHR